MPSLFIDVDDNKVPLLNEQRSSGRPCYTPSVGSHDKKGRGGGKGWVGKEESVAWGGLIRARPPTHSPVCLTPPGAAICDPEAIPGGEGGAVISCARIGTAVSYPVCKDAGGQAGCLDFVEVDGPQS